MITAIYIFIGGGLGSLLRYGIGSAVKNWTEMSFPLGTFLSNLLACILLAVFTVVISSKADQAEWIKPLLIVGFCGGFSTFSTFGYETATLIQQGHVTVALINILLSVSVGVGLIYWVLSK